MIELTNYQFFGETYISGPPAVQCTLPGWTYRIIDGELYRIVDAPLSEMEKSDDH
jgi:hypothetical protein